MTLETITNAVAHRLTNISVREDISLLRAEYQHQDSVVGIYFIDFAENAIEADIDEYQEKYISSDYYNHPGHLQWNYYLLFVRNEGIVPFERKEIIEKDDVYTRKFVFSLKELKNYFHYNKSEKKIDSDIISQWKERLREIDLDEVYDTTPYTQAVARFISNDVVKENITEQNISSSSYAATAVKRISTLNLRKNYRPFPVRRDFSFGTANLVQGVNGSGKTSFLEALELILAGKSSKDPGFNEANNCIEATYNDDTEIKDEYTPNDYAKYRNRDISWYSNAYKTGNELHLSFNRYNFYDSDAAYKLSHNADVSTISKYLSGIALGSEFNRIQDKMRGFLERYSKELRDRQNLLDAELKRKKEAEAALVAIQKSGNPQTYFDLFLAVAKDINWQLRLPKNSGDKDNTFESDYQQADAAMNSINQVLVTMRLRTIKSIQTEHKKYIDALSKFIDKKSEIYKQELLIDNQKKNDTKLSNDINLLTRAEKYLAEKDTFELKALQQRIGRLTAEKEKNKQILEAASEISTVVLLDEIVTFMEAKLQTKRNRDSLKLDLKKIENEIEELKSNLGKIESIISDLKSLGKEYLELNKQAESCPLCATEYTYAELSSRISGLDTTIKENKAINLLTGQKIGLEEKLQVIQLRIGNLEHIERIIQLAFPSTEQTSLTFFDVKSRIEEIRQSYSSLESDLLRLSTLNDNFDRIGLTESEYLEIESAFKAVYIDIPFENSSHPIISQLLEAYKNDLADRAGLLNELEIELRLLNDETQSIISESIPSEDFSNFQTELNYRIQLLNNVIENTDLLKKYLPIQDEDDLANVAQKLTKLYSAFREFRMVATESSQLELTQNIIVAADVKSAELSPVISKLEGAVNLLDEILKTDNEERILGDFLRENEGDIQHIFQIIHSPKEFSKILINYTTNTIHLKRLNSEEDVPLTKISTGQRSALALSIFLALNKKLSNGPGIILLDDPVTYTDDMNILSFLDYLREMTIRDKRQVFFATANQKLAGLFQKKFAFLNDLFKEFPFERQNTNGNQNEDLGTN